MRFKVAGETFVVVSNLPDQIVQYFFHRPMPYNLYINYYIELRESVAGEHDTCQNVSHIYLIQNADVPYSARICDGAGSLFVTGDLVRLKEKDYNWQFSLFGNKGILQRYILHVMEKKRKRLILHGCAIEEPKTGRIVVGLGKSGSGKSALTLTALHLGWKLIATEQVLIGEDFQLYRGNVHDNMSPLSVERIQRLLPEAQIFPDLQLVEPRERKVFVDMSFYSTDQYSYDLRLHPVTVALLAFHDKEIRQKVITDEDYYLRALQMYASEKITFPAIIGNTLIDAPFQGDIGCRSNIISFLSDSWVHKIFLGGMFEGFTDFLTGTTSI